MPIGTTKYHKNSMQVYQLSKLEKYTYGLLCTFHLENTFILL